MRTFFRFAHDSGWVPKNKALAIKPPKVDQPPTLPFTRDEVKRVLKACSVYPHEDRPSPTWGNRLKALVLLLRYSGLRASDAVTLSSTKVKDDVLTLRTEKTGTEVQVALPRECTAPLEAVLAPSGYYFWSGLSTKKACVGDYQRAFKKLFTLAGVKNGHMHRWRDTFTVELLLAGTSNRRMSLRCSDTRRSESPNKVTVRGSSPAVTAL